MLYNPNGQYPLSYCNFKPVFLVFPCLSCLYCSCVEWLNETAVVVIRLIITFQIQTILFKTLGSFVLNLRLFIRKMNQSWFSKLGSVNFDRGKFQYLDIIKCLLKANWGEWNLPYAVCDFYLAMDVVCSTSSIFNLVAISVDRYFAVTSPILYSQHRFIIGPEYM